MDIKIGCDRVIGIKVIKARIRIKVNINMIMQMK